MRVLKQSWRSLRSAPAHVMGVVGSVTVGLALSLLAWHIVVGLTYGDLPGLKERHRVARLHLQHAGTAATESVSGRQVGSSRWSRADVEALEAFPAPGVTGVGAEAVTTATVRLGSSTLRHSIAHTAAHYFETLGTEPLLGRVLTHADRNSAVAVLGYGLWTALQQPADILGQSLTVDGVPYTIIGVAPAHFGGLRIRDIGDGPLAGPQVWIPLTAELPLQAFARLHTGTFAGAIGEELAPLAKGLEEAQPGTRPNLAIVGQSIGLDPQERPGAAIAAVALFMTLPLAVLGLAMINVVNLQLARMADAMHTVRVRLSLGATPAQATAWLLAEGAALTALSAGAALLLVGATIPSLTPYAPFIAPVSAQAFVVAAVLAMLVVMLAGWLPTWLVARKVAGTGPRIGVPPASRLRRGLVVAQVGAALALVFVTSLCLRSVAIALGSVEAGAARTAFVPIDGARAAIWIDQVARVSDIEAAALATFIPQGGQIQYGPPAAEAAAMRTVDGGRISPAWVDAIGARLVAGALPAADTDALVITDGLAARLAPTPAEAVGQPVRVTEGDRSDVRTVAAVLMLPYRGPGGRSPQGVYLISNGPWPATTTGVVRGRTAPPDARLLRPTFAAAGVPEAPVSPTTLMHVLAGGLVDVRLLGGTFSVLGAGALLLSTSGVLALLLVLVRTRRREFAIRAALGASARGLALVVGRELSRILVWGTAIGLLLGAGGVALLQSQIANTSPVDPLAILATAAVMLGAAGLAAIVPAIRASRVAPVEALRG